MMEHDVMRIMPKVAVAVLASQSLLCNPSTTQAQSLLAPAMVRISLEKSTITQGEPTIVDVAIDNTSSTSVDFDPGYDKQRIGVTVIDPQGRSWKRQQPLTREGMRFSNAVRIDPGSANVTLVLLNEWFSFNKVGNYQIEVTSPLPSQKPSQDVRDTVSTLTLTVFPRDETELRSACADLVKQIESQNSAPAGMVLAEALSKIDDPTAVPFLAEAMKRKDLAAMMIGALARLKTDDAVKALISASRSEDPETRNLARAALAGVDVKPVGR